jgi:hypothetical protein
MSLDPRKASHMALYAADAECLFDTLDKGDHHGNPSLPPAPCAAPFALITGDAWEAVVQLRADDDLRLLQFLKRRFGVTQNNFYYGFLLRRRTGGDDYFAPGDYLAIVRGTAEPVEWVLDATATPELFSPRPHKLTGLVPSGFYSIYESMSARDMNGKELGDAATVIGNIANGDNKPLTVVGHSLGSTLATYLTLDLASEIHDPANHLDAYMIASPNPGDVVFAKKVRERVPNYNVVNWERDLVPRVPPPPFIALLNGSPTQNAFQLKASAVLAGSIPHNEPKCNHHAVCYALMLDQNNSVAAALTGRFGCVAAAGASFGGLGIGVGTSAGSIVAGS